jgi:predicted lactoylglutathione lyase
MLLTEPFFRGFAGKELCDTNTHTEGLFAVSCPSREAVDTMVNLAIAGGGQPAKDPMDHGWMYGWSFYDLDGHHWEVLWMDLEAVPA